MTPWEKIISKTLGSDHFYLGDAIAKAITVRLNAAGYVIVPKKSTRWMRAMGAMQTDVMTNDPEVMAEAIYGAMVTAAPNEESPPAPQLKEKC